MFKGVLLCAFAVLAALPAYSDDWEEFSRLSGDFQQALADGNETAALRLLDEIQTRTKTLTIGESQSPAVMAIVLDRKAIGRDILLKYPVLMNQRGNISRYAARTPLEAAVESGDIELCRWLVEHGADVSMPYYPFDREEFPGNLLGFSHSPEMFEYLKTFRLPMTFHPAQTGAPLVWTCNDDRVNLRAEPSPTAAVVRQLKKNEGVVYRGNTAYRTKIGTNEQFWIQVKTKTGETGWVYGAFLDSPWIGEE